jgi:hypothetical protein
MESQKERKCHSLAFIVEAKLCNTATFKKIPAFAEMTTSTFCEFVNINKVFINYTGSISIKRLN